MDRGVQPVTYQFVDDNKPIVDELQARIKELESQLRKKEESGQSKQSKKLPQPPPLEHTLREWRANSKAFRLKNKEMNEKIKQMEAVFNGQKCGKTPQIAIPDDLMKQTFKYITEF